MALTAGQVALLRCEVNRTADLARAAGVKMALARVSASSPAVDAELVRATASAVGYALTLWEVSTVRAAGAYKVFDVVYDAAEAFVDAPSAAGLAKHGPNIALLLAAIAQLRGIADPCGVTVTLPGLVPPAAELRAPLERPPAPKAPPARQRSRKLGHAILGGMSAATLALVGAAVWNASNDDQPIDSW